MSLFKSFRPLLRLVSSCHISAKSNLNHIGKANLFKAFFDGCHANIFTKLTFSCRSAHGNYFLACLNLFYDINQESLTAYSCKWTAVNAVAALDAFILINFAVTIFIVRNSTYRTCLLTWSFEMHNCVIRTGVSAHSTLFTLGRVNVHMRITGCYGSKLTRIKTRFSHTESTVISNRIC